MLVSLLIARSRTHTSLTLFTVLSPVVQRAVTGVRVPLVTAGAPVLTLVHAAEVALGRAAYTGSFS